MTKEQLEEKIEAIKNKVITKEIKNVVDGQKYLMTAEVDMLLAEIADALAEAVGGEEEVFILYGTTEHGDSVEVELPVKLLREGKNAL